MRTNFYAFYLLVITIFGWSCTSDKKIDGNAVQEEIKEREIKKISEAEIISKVHEIGNSIAVAAKQTLGQNLQKAIQQDGLNNAIGFCNLNAMPLVDSLSKVYGADIKRVSLKARNPSDLPNEQEQMLLEAYAYQWKDSIPLQTNVQTLDDNTYLFTKPIMVDNALCLSCHGTVENGMLKETDDFIKTKYPEDNATGYQIGDLRGMWSIILKKKDVIQSM